MPHPARVLGAADVRLVLSQVRGRRHPTRDNVMLLLSFKAGLRACEIAGLRWSMLLRANCNVGQQLHVAASIAKNGTARAVPMHVELQRALTKLHRDQGWPRDGPVILSERGGAMTPHSVVNWFRRLYAEVGLDGCSSHSGRRTFITRSARLIHKTGGSLRDVQELAGHRSLTTTERYIAGDRDAQRKLIRLI